MTYQFHSEEISCEHCRRRIEEALGGNPKVESCRVDLETKIIFVESSLSQEELINLIDEAGYPALPVAP